MKTTDKVRIRMYRQGLGDCFLLTFYSDEKSIFNMVIDCGVLSTSSDHVKLMLDVAKDIAKETGNEIDILVATHEHWDHVSGFVQAATIFDSIKIKEIWMGWPENDKDPFSKSLKDANKLRLNTLMTAYDKMNSAKHTLTFHMSPEQKLGMDKYIDSFEGFFEFFGISSDGKGKSSGLANTGDAMKYLLGRKAKHVFHTPHSNSVVTNTNLPGVRFYILGPPKDIKALRKMNPSKNDSEVYEMVNNLSSGLSFCSAIIGDTDPNIPFADADTFPEDTKSEYFRSYLEKDNSWRKIDNDWWMLSSGLMAQVLDKVVNNTSLTFAIELIESGKVLLFAADAQVGNWLSWKSYNWKVQNEKKDSVVTIDDLLSRTVLYKVGHHGSHNATLREDGLEKMISNDLIAMLPVNKEMAGKKGWNKMPFKPLLESLEEKTGNRVVIMDESYPGAVTKSNRSPKGNNSLYYDVVIN
jgi:hypothetical protein